MDNGEVIPGLDQSWTMAGAKLFEWIAGFMMLICTQELFFKGTGARYMPVMMLAWIGTTFGMAAIRKQFPDEERGLRNMCMVALGLAPPGIPAPAALQPIWSACPLRELEPETEYMYLGLDKVFVAPRDSDRDIDY